MMRLNGKGHLRISGQLPYSLYMGKTKGEGAGKGPQRQRGMPIFYLVNESPGEEQFHLMLI